MPRRRCKRRITVMFKDIFYKPRGVPLSKLEVVVITHDELEVLRLRFIKGLKQEEAARKLGISQSQYQRDYVRVLKKITDAFVNGKAIKLGN